MASNKTFRAGPVAILNTVGNILNPPTAAGGVNAGAASQFIILNHICVTNKTAGAVTISAWIGATGASAAGTEALGWSATPVPANSSLHWYGKLRLDAADFLTMQAGAVTSLVFGAEGEIGVSG